jgi:hypothetical protein
MVSELHDAYTGRLCSFLNNARTSLGSGSFVVCGCYAAWSRQFG